MYCGQLGIDNVGDKIKNWGRLIIIHNMKLEIATSDRSGTEEFELRAKDNLADTVIKRLAEHVPKVVTILENLELVMKEKKRSDLMQDFSNAKQQIQSITPDNEFTTLPPPLRLQLGGDGKLPGFPKSYMQALETLYKVANYLETSDDEAFNGLDLRNIATKLFRLLNDMCGALEVQMQAPKKGDVYKNDESIEVRHSFDNRQPTGGLPTVYFVVRPGFSKPIDRRTKVFQKPQIDVMLNR